MPDKRTDTVPVMANINPWNEAILRELRTFKTLHFNWSYRGRILLYNSKSRTDDAAAVDYEISGEQPKGVIVGSVVVYECEIDLRQGWIVWLRDPQRFANPIPYTPPRGSIRLSRAPRSLLDGGNKWQVRT